MEVGKKLLYDEFMAELFYSVREENIETNELTIRLAEEFSLVTYIDMEREDKATAAYILDGVRSMKNVSDEDKQQNKGRLAKALRTSRRNLRRSKYSSFTSV